MLDGSVHALDLPVSLGMVGFSQAVFDSMNETEPVEGMAAEACGWPLSVLRQTSELDALIGEHGMDAIRNGLDESFEERCCGSLVWPFDEFDYSELRGLGDGYEQVELALGGSHLSQVDMEEADRIGVELLPLGLVAFDIRQPTDAVTLQTPMK